jgi:hypothetical protein
MNFTTVDKKEPIDMEYYLVRCTNYSESGFEVAQWDKSYNKWRSSDGSDSINDFVTEYGIKVLSSL